MIEGQLIGTGVADRGSRARQPMVGSVVGWWGGGWLLTDGRGSGEVVSRWLAADGQGGGWWWWAVRAGSNNCLGASYAR